MDQGVHQGCAPLVCSLICRSLTLASHLFPWVFCTQRYQSSGIWLSSNSATHSLGDLGQAMASLCFSSCLPETNLGDSSILPVAQVDPLTSPQPCS